MAEGVYILSGVRTAIGAFGGGLMGKTPDELGSLVAVEAMARAGIAPGDVGHVVFGNVIPTGPKDAYLARIAAMNAGVPREVPAMTLNRLCGSGVQAIISAAQGIMLGDYGLALAGGAEVMSRAPHYVQVARFGQKMGDVGLVDGLQGVLTDPFGNGIRGSRPRMWPNAMASRARIRMPLRWKASGAARWRRRRGILPGRSCRSRGWWGAKR